jgi:methanol--5-hydroxybenzimidazolylcobamide Co-methyltransferase
VKVFDKLAYGSLDDFLFGLAPQPVRTKNGMVIGGGDVYPEINFTLPPIDISASNMPEIRSLYSDMINGVLKRAKDLHAPGVVVELELLPPMTENPAWGIEINNLVREAMFEHEAKYGLKSVLRATPNDVREINRPPLMRQGMVWENMLKTMAGCAKGGADFLAIESTGGKEIHDDALVNADLPKVIFSLGVLGARDMKFLWEHIVRISNENGCLPSGDTACGFANTAMVLAEKRFIPKVFAAVVRVATVARSLVAYEVGAVGPSKDCAYEGPYMKAIAGIPISMEGKSCACAHLSPLGNIAAAVTDLWSNESVQQVKLLSEMAPIVSMEQLIYDCRLMNQATKHGCNRMFRNLLVESDAWLDVQAFVLKPDVVFEISRELVKTQDPFQRTKWSAQLALDKIRTAVEAGQVKIEERELKWLDIMSAQIEEIPDDAEECWHSLKSELDLSKFIPSEYGLE